MDSKKKYKAKFNPLQIQDMRKLFEEGYGIGYIARKYDCWTNAVWHHVYDLSTPRIVSKKEKNLFTKNSKLNINDIRKIRRLGLSGVSAADIGQSFNISETAALGIMKGKTYRWVEGAVSNGEITPIDIPKEKRKTDLKSGIKVGQKRSVKSGVLVKLGKKYGVKPCTIRRWVLKGKLKICKSDRLD
jgi:hypothetical protein